MRKLLIATHNPGKRVEIEDLLAATPGGWLERFELWMPSALGLDEEVAETGDTYQDNAALKARALCQASGLLTLADDSGLEVDALGGAPGVHSRRFAPHPTATDADRRALLVEKLAGRPRPWTARFRCVIALAAPGEELRFAEGRVEGEILPEERGHNGFGYDPLFYIPELDRTMAELTRAEKNRLSHRARALLAALPLLEELAG
ncbi:MAG: RdgB/HAM1 family non-canonical purine NTP pyrophosphatase [Chloroflexi bacterium]|jgi:XTP/dITP diphosphohydrolase|nr:RdgB/HAM1 family non-canonical purine NTP pyrophosphatase [Anaerolineaceae bacterium]NMB90316.1 RdgB/HAM1 family non-canonical purine NTP pyrophosphatase [Chloroflexota bacterium]